MKNETRIALGKPSQSGELILERRYRIARDYTPLFLTGGRLLDIGCGNGLMTALFAPEFEIATAVDVRPNQLKRVPEGPYPVASKGELMPFADGSFDAAISFEVIEHVENPVTFLREMHRLLRPGAVAMISVPNKWWVFETHGANLPLLPWNRVPFFSWLPARLHSRWAKARIYTRKNLRDLLHAGGFDKYELLYLTAPMDRAKPAWLRAFLQSTLFRADTTKIPFGAVSHVAVLYRT